MNKTLVTFSMTLVTCECIMPFDASYVLSREYLDGGWQFDHRKRGDLLTMIAYISATSRYVVCMTVCTWGYAMVKNDPLKWLCQWNRTQFKVLQKICATAAAAKATYSFRRSMSVKSRFTRKVPKSPFNRVAKHKTVHINTFFQFVAI